MINTRSIRLADLEWINCRIICKGDQYEALDECKVKWRKNGARTRCYCEICCCVLYKKSVDDNVNDNTDVDDIYECKQCAAVYCFRCLNTKSLSSYPTGVFSKCCVKVHGNLICLSNGDEIDLERLCVS